MDKQIRVRVVEAAHRSIPNGSILKGRILEPYDKPGMYWMRTKLHNGVSRTIIVEKIRRH